VIYTYSWPNIIKVARGLYEGAKKCVDLLYRKPKERDNLKGLDVDERIIEYIRKK
jgi:hypothetical protein